jgi:hypothetical protein
MSTMLEVLAHDVTDPDLPYTVDVCVFHHC